jgi:hypothetical protein
MAEDLKAVARPILRGDHSQWRGRRLAGGGASRGRQAWDPARRAAGTGRQYPGHALAAPGTPTIVPVGAAGSAPPAAPGRWAEGGAVGVGGAAPGSRSPWPPPTGSRAGPARGCGAAPGRRATRPHETSTGEGEQATAHRSPSSSSACWSRPRSTSDTPRLHRRLTLPPFQACASLAHALAFPWSRGRPGRPDRCGAPASGVQAKAVAQVSGTW